LISFFIFGRDMLACDDGVGSACLTGSRGGNSTGGGDRYDGRSRVLLLTLVVNASLLAVLRF
jgi:hypothetical protein